jgi:diguanylate cyclase (GGDEF)-like protein
MDINGFGWVNNHFGHDEGDRVIKHLGAIMVECVNRAGSKSVSVVRWGGDEFVLLVEGMEEKAVQQLLVSDLHAALLKSPYKLHREGQTEDEEYVLSVACGEVKLQDFGREKKEEVLKKADTAMYFAKDLAKKVLVGPGNSVPNPEWAPRGLIVSVYSQGEKSEIDTYRELTKPPKGPPDPKNAPKATEILNQYARKHLQDLFKHFTLGSGRQGKVQKKNLK